MSCLHLLFFFFFFNDTATTEIYTLSLHDALPISDFGGIYRRATERRGHPPSLRSEEHTSELQSRQYLVCRLLLEKKKRTSASLKLREIEMVETSLPKCFFNCVVSSCAKSVRLSNIVRFFFNDTATTEIYTLSLHDALPICRSPRPSKRWSRLTATCTARRTSFRDRKSTRLNSSHANISYAVFCLKKKN